MPTPDGRARGRAREPDLNLPMRAWRTSPDSCNLPAGCAAGGGGFVIDCGPSVESTEMVLGMVRELREGPWCDPHDFVLVNASGDIQREFSAIAWIIEKELGARVFAVVGDTLKELVVRAFFSEPLRVERVEKIVMADLQSVATDDQETRRFLSDAIARNRQQREEERRTQDRIGDERIAAIQGAEEAFETGEAFAHAQNMLIARVRSFSDRIDGAILAALVQFGSLQPQIHKATVTGAAARSIFTDVLDAFVHACQVAAFDRTAGNSGAPAPVGQNIVSFAALPKELQIHLLELENILRGIEGDLLQRAEWQAWGDALGNANASRTAVEHVARAHQRMGCGGLTPNVVLSLLERTQTSRDQPHQRRRAPRSRAA